MNLLLLLLFGFFNRCRGGFLPLGSTTAARILYWALPNALVAGWVMTKYDISPFYAIATFFLVWLASTIPHGKWFSSPYVKDCAVMSLIGIVQALAVVLIFALEQHSLLLLSLFGAIKGVAYYIGWNYLDKRRFKLFNQLFAENGAEWSEILAGIGRGLLFVILLEI